MIGQLKTLMYCVKYTHYSIQRIIQTRWATNPKVLVPNPTDRIGCRVNVVLGELSGY